MAAVRKFLSQLLLPDVAQAHAASTSEADGTIAWSATAGCLVVAANGRWRKLANVSTNGNAGLTQYVGTVDPSTLYTMQTGDVWVDTSAAPLTGRNVVVNGDMSVWQAGTGAFTTNGAYCADQTIGYAASGTTQSISRETLGAADPFDYAAQIVTTTGSAVGSYQIFYLPIENVKTLAGEVCTLSFYAKASASGKYVATEINQAFGSGGSSGVTGIGVTKHALTTSLARYQCTFTVPSLSGKTIGTGSYLIIQFWTDAGSNWNSRTGSLGNQSATISITGVQLERGSVASPFEFVDPSIQLIRCRRYCRVYGGVANVPVGYGNPWTGVYGVNASVHHLMLDTPMRITPTVAQTGNWEVYNTVDGVADVANSPGIVGDPNALYLIEYRATGNWTTGNTPHALLRPKDTSARLTLSARLV